MKLNSKQKWLIGISIIVYVVVIGLHLIDASDPDSANYKGGHASKSIGDNN